MKKGFTLIEMLVVIGIIAILAAALAAGYSSVTKTAQKTRGAELVANVATALASIYQSSGRWPKPLLDGNGGDEYRLGPKAGAVLAKRGGFTLSYKKEGDGYVLVGQDKFGVLDPWAQAVVKGKKSASLSTPVPSGGTVADHIVRYALDTEGEGLVTANVGGRQITVRATAIVWSCGPDGKFDALEKMGRSDDIYSFNMGQVVK